MKSSEYAEQLGLTRYGQGEENDNGYVITLPDSDTFGLIYIKLENNPDVDALEDNQVVTEQGSSLLYSSIDEDFLINLIADWSGNIYQVIITRMD